MTFVSKKILKKAKSESGKFIENINSELRPSKYIPSSYYLDIIKNPYYEALIILRHYIKLASDDFFSNHVGAKNIDLFMMTSSVSSPMGPGSDSEAIAFKLGENLTNLTDSSQFGFEPLLGNNIDKLYCYLPSMRGEDPDERHLNQFYHCEAEILDKMENLIPLVEDYIKALSEICMSLMPIVEKMAIDPLNTKAALISIQKSERLDSVTFDEVFKDLEGKGGNEYVIQNNFGRKISAKGERAYAANRGNFKPFWITNFDRDMTPFYQKPFNNDSVIASDLMFPPLSTEGFSGEIVGAGQRQDNPSEIYESLKRQSVDSKNYEWYIDLRRQDNYKITSGFGLGIERFIAWVLGYENIRDVILYPRLKNVESLP